jgi:hypothetical protein
MKISRLWHWWLTSQNVKNKGSCSWQWLAAEHFCSNPGYGKTFLASITVQNMLTFRPLTSVLPQPVYSTNENPRKRGGFPVYRVHRPCLRPCFLGMYQRFRSSPWIHVKAFKPYKNLWSNTSKRPVLTYCSWKCKTGHGFITQEVHFDLSVDWGWVGDLTF